MGSGKIIAIAAMDESRVIGIDNRIPWHLPEDLKRFSALTTGHVVLMGRKTFDSLPAKWKPLPNRRNVVLTRQSAATFPAGVEVWHELDSHLADPAGGVPLKAGENLWVIGGEEIYLMTLPYWDEVYLTLVPGTHQGDAFFPRFEDHFELLTSERGQDCSFLHYVRKEGN